MERKGLLWCLMVGDCVEGFGAAEKRRGREMVAGLLVHEGVRWVVVVEKNRVCRPRVEVPD